jgi:hypothetical protein
MPGHRVSRGNAQAVFQEGAGAGRLLRLRANVKFGTPGDLNIRASIRPFSGTDFDGHHYCAEDWHVILIAYFSDDFGRNDSFTKQIAESELNPLVINFTLDGKALTDTERTEVKNVPNAKESIGDGVTKAYFIQQGRLMSPQELVVGEHTLSFTAVGPGLDDADSITFFIDAPGTGACA